jgi:hypothetical protein
MWRPEKKANRLTLTIDCLASTPLGANSQIEAEAERVASFRGIPLVQVKYR